MFIFWRSSRSSVSEGHLMRLSTFVCLSGFSHRVGNLHYRGSLLEHTVAQRYRITLVQKWPVAQQCHMWHGVKKAFRMSLCSKTVHLSNLVLFIPAFYIFLPSLPSFLYLLIYFHLSLFPSFSLFFLFLLISSFIYLLIFLHRCLFFLLVLFVYFSSLFLS
jgi:hypothetical protein